jgi:electron transfer flavoprotein alpha subunit
MSNAMKIIVIAEHEDGLITSATRKTINCASQISSEVDLLILGNNTDLEEQAIQIDSVLNVLVVQDETFNQQLSAIMAPIISDLTSGYDCLLLPSTTFGRDLAPRVSVLKDVCQITDIMEVLSPRVFKRPIYAGNAIETIEVPDGQMIVATVRPASFKEVGTSNQASLNSLEMPNIDLPNHTRFLGVSSEKTERPDLQVASIVISGGRGVGSAENFEILYQLADKLGASVGASRAAVDAGYVSNDMQVGQTGKIISPDLYFAFGISGAIQHVAGIKDSGTIVAINKDPDAPIFEIADIGIVADLFEFIPEFLAKLD